jgi:hypothetical protein
VWRHVSQNWFETLDAESARIAVVIEQTDNLQRAMFRAPDLPQADLLSAASAQREQNSS